jgi:hypothetical protein
MRNVTRRNARLEFLFGTLAALPMLAGVLPSRAFFKDGDDPEPGAGSGDPKPDVYLERRNKELEGMTVEALRAQVLRLEGDNRSQRSELRTLKESAKEIDTLKTELEQFKPFGKPEEIKLALENGRLATEKAITFEREKLVSNAAQHAMIDGKPVNPLRLAEIAKLKNLELEIGETTVVKDGKPVNVPTVKVKSGDSSLEFGEFAKTQLGDFTTWLLEGAQPAQAAGTIITPQPAGGGTSSSVLQAAIQAAITPAPPAAPATAVTPAYDPFSA